MTPSHPFRCTSCGRPLDPVVAAEGTHPTCDPDEQPLRRDDLEAAAVLGAVRSGPEVEEI